MSNSTRKTKKDAPLVSDNHVDVIVLRVGTCGEDLSLQLLGAELKVVGIEAALVGGACAYWACWKRQAISRLRNASWKRYLVRL